ncbi:MAG: hypothetical protein KDK36_19550 [Leptospiraceae bacterium]|nr:hypothetical protein [Leptospiraceae bacterium]
METTKSYIHKLIIIFLLLSMSQSCMSKILAITTYGLSIPIEKAIDHDKEKPKECFIEIEKVRKTSIPLRYPISTVGAFTGFILDVGIGFYGIALGISNSAAEISIGGFLYLFTSPFYFAETESIVKASKVNITTGWVYNPYGPCKNYSDFFVLEITKFSDNLKTWEEFTEEGKLTFYQNLMEDLKLEPSQEKALKEEIGNPLSYRGIEISGDTKFPILIYYIYYRGGKKALNIKFGKK